MIEMFASLLPVLIPAIGGLFGAAQSIKFVSEGERAILLRFDKAVRDKNGKPKVVHPGLRLIVPVMHKLARIHVRQRTINLPLQRIVLSDNTVFSVAGIVLCRVKDSADDLYRALFETTGINQAINDIGQSVIRDVLHKMTSRMAIEGDRNLMHHELKTAMQAYTDAWGVEIISFQLSDFNPSQGTEAVLLVQAQVVARTEALVGAAKTIGVSVRTLNGGLGAALVGTPLVTTPQQDPYYDESED